MMRRVAKAVLKVLLLAELGYVVGMLAFLNSGILPWLINSDKDDSLKITWDFAYSWFPGSVRAQDLSVRVNDEDVQVYFHLSSTRVKVELAKLLQKEFTASQVAVDGLDFRLRLRRKAKELQSPLVAFLPPIPGLIPVLSPQKSEAPSANPWKVVLRAVRINNLHQAWVEEYRYRGKANVTGDLYLHPGVTTTVRQASLTSDSGAVTFGDNEVASEVRAWIQAQVGPYDKRNFKKTNEIIDYLSARVDGTANVTGFEFLNHYLRKVQNIELSGGVGPIAAHFVLDKGRLTSPSTLKVQADDLKASLWDQRARGNAYIDWHIDHKGEGRLFVEFPRFVIQYQNRSEGRIEGRNLSLLATTPDLSLKEPFQRLDVELRTPEAHISDLSYFEGYFPKESRVRMHGGQGTLDAAVFASSDPKRKDSGYLHLTATGAQLSLKGAELQGDIKVDGVLHQGDLRRGRLDVSGTQVYLTHVLAVTRFEGQKDRYKDWWGRIDVRKGILQLKGAKSFMAELAIRGRDARPILGISTEGAIPGILGGILAFENLTASLNLQVSDELLSLSHCRADGGGVSVRGWLRAHGDDRNGKVLVSYGPIAAGLAIQDDGLEIKLNDAYRWYGQPVPAE